MATQTLHSSTHIRPHGGTRATVTHTSAAGADLIVVIMDPSPAGADDPATADEPATADDPTGADDPVGRWLGPHVADPDLGHLVRWAREAESIHVRLGSLAAIRRITATFEAHAAYGIEGVRAARELEPTFEGSLADLVMTIGGLVTQRPPVDDEV